MHLGEALCPSLLHERPAMSNGVLGLPGRQHNRRLDLLLRVPCLPAELMDAAHTARFPDPGLSTQQHYLTRPFPDLGLACLQQGEFGFPSHQWGKPSRRRYF
jgi:hypothetical protein